MEAKRCSACGQVKKVTEFYKDRTRRDGLTTRCKNCDKTRGRAFYAANPGRKAAYYQANRAQKIREVRAGQRKIRAAAIVIYGGRCELCGAQEWLEFDHPDGDGAEHREVEPWLDMLRRIVREGAPLTDVRLRLLCYPCHHPEVVAAVPRLFRRLAWVAARVGFTDEERTILRDLAEAAKARQT